MLNTLPIFLNTCKLREIYLCPPLLCMFLPVIPLVVEIVSQASAIRKIKYKL